MEHIQAGLAELIPLRAFSILIIHGSLVLVLGLVRADVVAVKPIARAVKLIARAVKGPVKGVIPEAVSIEKIETITCKELVDGCR